MFWVPELPLFVGVSTFVGGFRAFYVYSCRSAWLGSAWLGLAWLGRRLSSAGYRLPAIACGALRCHVLRCLIEDNLQCYKVVTKVILWRDSNVS